MIMIFYHGNMKMESSDENGKPCIKVSGQEDRGCDQEARNLKQKPKSSFTFILIDLAYSKFDTQTVWTSDIKRKHMSYHPVVITKIGS